MRTRFTLLFCLAACSGDGSGDATALDSAPDVCMYPGMCVCPTGSAEGQNACGRACTCAASVDASAGPAQVAPPPVVSEPSGGSTSKALDCEPGLYLGEYDCTIDLGDGPVPLNGTVSFELEVEEKTQQAGSDCQEFCDLTIAEGKGNLFGVVFGLVGFRTGLSGGLDCTTGEFHAEAADGIYGFPVPSDIADLEGQWSVLEPAFGTFVGDLMGVHATESPQTISGTWSLADSGSGVECTGPFQVTHMR